MSNQCQFIRRTAAVLMACGLIASLLPGFAAVDKADNQWGPGYRITHNGLRIDGIRADNPTNRVIYDNDFVFDAMDFAYLAAQDKLGRVDFKGFIVTRNSHMGPDDGYAGMVRQFNHYRALAIRSGLNIPRHIDGAREPLRRPGSGKIDDTQYTLSDGARLIIQQADASTPDNPLIVFVGGQLTTVATALLEKPSIANRMLVLGAGQLEDTYNSDDGWAAYVTGMRAPVVNIMEDFRRPNGYDKSKGQYEPLPKNPLIKAFYNTKVTNEKDPGIVDGGLVVWLFNQNLVTGVQRRDLTVPGVFSSRGRLLKASIRDVNRSPYGHLHLPDGSCKFAAMIDAMVAVLADPRVWDPDYSAKPVPNQSTNSIASAQAIDQTTQAARTARAEAIVPLDGPVLVGKPVTFRINGNRHIHWDLGDGATAEGSSVTHTYQKPGVYRVVTATKDESYPVPRIYEQSYAIVRVHTPETVHLPQVLLDTDARNEQDDQHYIAYALFSQLDVLCINSVHHNKWADETETQLVPAHSHWRGGLESETWNYDEIIKVLDLAKRSGLPAARVPRVFRGATKPLKTPSSKRWYDTTPIVTQASNAILAAARGASPDNPVWVLPVGPCSNIASAILQVRQEGWETEFRKRIRVHWVGGSGTNIQADFNGRNDPWSTHVVYASGIEFLVLTAPASGLITVDKRVDGHRYPNNPLGDYLKQIMPINNKSLYDLGVPAIIISRHLGTSWIRRVEPRILVNTYEYQATTAPTTLNVVFEVDHEAIVDDFFNTVNGKPTALPPRRQKRSSTETQSE